MVIGEGMIAKAFNDYSDIEEVVIFASGVSNSLEKNEQEFYKEENLLCKVINNTYGRLLVYFSTCSVYDSSVNETPYVKHKLKMETIVAENAKLFNIFRIPQVIGKTGSPTLVKYLFDKIQNEGHFELWIDSYRNLIDIEDVAATVNYIIQNNLFRNEIVDISSPVNTPVLEVVEIIEKILNKRANYTVVKKGASYHIDLGQCKEIYRYLGIIFDEDYIRRTIERYYTDSFNENSVREIKSSHQFSGENL